ncbi:MAG: DMT family transporter [Thermoanaerobaculia bacterium]
MTLRTLGLTAAAMAAFAANSVLCRAALGRGLVDAPSFTTIRVASGALALGLLLRLRGRRAPASRDLLASAALFAYAFSFSLAYVRIPAALGALLLFGAVQVTMVGRGLATGERPRPAEWLGLGLSVSGLLALTLPGVRGGGDLPGALLMLGAGAAWGVYSLRGRTSPGDPLAANATRFAWAVPMVLLASLAAAPVSLPRLTAAGAALAVASGALASGLGYAIWYAAMRGLTATRAALVQLSVPPLAALGGVALLGEEVTPRLVLSAAAVLGGIALALAGGRR